MLCGISEGEAGGEAGVQLQQKQEAPRRLSILIQKFYLLVKTHFFLLCDKYVLRGNNLGLVCHGWLVVLRLNRNKASWFQQVKAPGVKVLPFPLVWFRKHDATEIVLLLTFQP